MLSSQDRRQGRLDRLRSARILFVIPAVVWGIATILDVLTQVAGLTPDSKVSATISAFARWTFVLALIWCALAAFLTSYRVLERVAGRNLLAFVLVQGIAYFLFRAVAIPLPSLGKGEAVGATIVVGLLTLLVVYLLQRGIDIQALEAARNAAKIESLDRAGIVVSVVFSAVLASLVYLGGNQGGIAFVPWGVFFGTAIAGLTFEADRLIVGLLLFLAPGDAVTIYNLLNLGEKVKTTRDARDIQIEISRLTGEQERLELEQLANELEEQVRTSQTTYIKESMLEVIGRLKNSPQLPPEERRAAFAHARVVAQKLRSGQPLLSLPSGDNTALTVPQKVSYHIGLSDAEIHSAITEGIIDPAQAHLWRPDVQDYVRLSLEDLRLERLLGKPPLYVSATLESEADVYKVPLRSLAELLNSYGTQQRTGNARSLTLLPIKGEIDERVMEARFSTAVHAYSAIVHKAERDVVLLALASIPVAKS